MNSQCDINKVLIGSAAKRIWGALLESEEFKIKRKISIKTFIFGLLFGLFLCILCIIKLSFIILIN